MAIKRILAIDGGGIRGLIPALVLVKVEELTGKRIFELFDVIAGTSTGGILAAGLCVPADGGSRRAKFEAKDLVDLYRKHGQDIFGKGFLRKMASLVYGAEYSPASLEARLREQLGDSKIGDAVTGLLITSYDMRAGEAWFFSSAAVQAAQTEAAGQERNYPLWQIARATSAAPTYFPPFRFLPTFGQATLVDGGVFANNPALCAWVDAHDGDDPPSTDSMILSLGTGSVPHPVTYSSARRWGKVRWAQPAIAAFLDGQSDTVDYQVGRLFDPENYLRLQAKLTVDHEKMDNVNEANLAALEEAAGRLLTDNAQRLADFCKRLIATRERQPSSV